MFPFLHDYPYSDLHEIDLAYLLHLMADLQANSKTLLAWKTEHEDEYKDLLNKVNGLIENLVDVIVPWDSSVAYRVYSIVEYQGTNYIAIRDVPVGAMITDTDYWQPANTVMEQINAIGVVTSETQEISEENKKKFETLLLPSLISSDNVYMGYACNIQGVEYRPESETYVAVLNNELVEFANDMKTINRRLPIAEKGGGVSIINNGDTVIFPAGDAGYGIEVNYRTFTRTRNINIPEGLNLTQVKQFIYMPDREEYIMWAHNDDFTEAGYVILNEDVTLKQYVPFDVGQYMKNITRPDWECYLQTIKPYGNKIAVCFSIFGLLVSNYAKAYANAIGLLDPDTFELLRISFLNINDAQMEIEDITLTDPGLITAVGNPVIPNAYVVCKFEVNGTGNSMIGAFYRKSVLANFRYTVHYDESYTGGNSDGTAARPYTNFTQINNELPNFGEITIQLHSDVTNGGFIHDFYDLIITSADANNRKRFINGLTFESCNVAINYIDLEGNDFIDLKGGTQARMYQIRVKNGTRNPAIKVENSKAVINWLTIDNSSQVVIQSLGGTVYAQNVSGNGSAILFYNNFGFMVLASTATTTDSYGVARGGGLTYVNKTLMPT